jgi:hypothetical protein
MSLVGRFLRSVALSFKRNLDSINYNQQYLHGLAEVFNFVGALSDMVFTYVPLYLFNLVFGVILISDSHGIASSKLFQYVLASTIGFALALVWIGIAVYRSVRPCYMNIIFNFYINKKCLYVVVLGLALPFLRVTSQTTILAA